MVQILSYVVNALTASVCGRNVTDIRLPAPHPCLSKHTSFLVPIYDKRQSQSRWIAKSQFIQTGVSVLTYLSILKTTCTWHIIWVAWPIHAVERKAILIIVTLLSGSQNFLYLVAHHHCSTTSGQGQGHCLTNMYNCGLATSILSHHHHHQQYATTTFSSANEF